MTQDDERLAAALARLTAALASLEAASRKILEAQSAQDAMAQDSGAELAKVMARAARLEAACDQVSHSLKVATESLAEIVAKQIGPPEE